jgi:4-amino-4-deoxy-L-arabinose transferase-like glycosyltransferase
MARRRIRAKPEAVEGAWLIAHRRLVLSLVIAAAVAVRAVYFLQLNATPFVALHHWRQTDMHYYDEWARAIADGDWRSASIGVPMHRWHRDVAAIYFAQHPDRRAGFEHAAAHATAPADADAALWAAWMRTPRFYQDPLYPYLVAITYKTFGADVRYVLAWQLALGVASTVLIWMLARRFFGDLVGACAAGLAILSGPLMFYEMLLLRDSSIVFAGLAIVWLTERTMARRTWPWWAALGLALGAACLLKSTFLLLGAGAVAMLVAAARRSGASIAVPATMLAAGFAAAIAPVVARNIAVQLPPFTLATSGPLTFVAANDVNTMPDVGFGIDAPLLARFLGETSGGWRPAIAQTFASHTLASYGGLLWRKWDRSWHWFEIPNNENFYYLQMQAPVLAWLPVTFWICAPLALVGLVLGTSRLRDAWPLYLLAGTAMAPMLLFYVLGRFRVGLIAAAIPFAALAIVETFRSIRRRAPTRAVAIAAAALLIAAWTGRPLASDQLRIRTADWILAYSVRYQDEVYGALDRKDWAHAGAAYLEFFRRYEPDDAQILASGDPHLAPELADMHHECADILTLAGQTASAAAEMARSRRLLSLRELR